MFGSSVLTTSDKRKYPYHTHYVYPKSEMIPRHSLKCPGRGMNRWIRIWVVLLASLDAYFRIVFRYGGLILLNMQRPRRAPRSKPRPSVSINAGTFYLHGVKPSQSTHSDDQDQVQWRASCRRMRVTCPALTSRKKVVRRQLQSYISELTKAIRGGYYLHGANRR